MNDTYRIVDKCIKELGRSHWPTKQKLEIETLLIRAKRLLLAVEGEVPDAECRKDLEIDAFYAGFCSACSSLEAEAVEKLKADVLRLLAKVTAMVEAAGKQRGRTGKTVE